MAMERLPELQLPRQCHLEHPNLLLRLLLNQLILLPVVVVVEINHLVAAS